MSSDKAHKFLIHISCQLLCLFWVLFWEYGNNKNIKLYGAKELFILNRLMSAVCNWNKSCLSFSRAILFIIIKSRVKNNFEWDRNLKWGRWLLWDYYCCVWWEILKKNIKFHLQDFMLRCKIILRGDYCVIIKERWKFLIVRNFSSKLWMRKILRKKSFSWHDENSIFYQHCWWW